MSSYRPPVTAACGVFDLNSQPVARMMHNDGKRASIAKLSAGSRLEVAS